MTAALYPCEITHVRAHPVRRAFRYRGYLWLVDLDDLPRVPPALRPFARFRAGDHLGDPASPLRANVDAYLARHGISLAGGRVLMLGHAAALGYVFNPLTVFWCHRADGTLAAVIAEVHNTYGQRHVYLLHPDCSGRAEADKDFYVSPFLPVAGRYRLHLPEPGGTLRLSVTLHLDGRTVLAARVTGRRRPYTPWRLLGCALRHPWVTGQVTALIHWQGIRLAARRLPVFPRPAHYAQEGVQ
ncbi:MAG TPA: DUF1365 domain-containing protein [Streptosporangiaceae bacterium]|nr:DUF1365 domain-containing protein [Streptosporangiaceae bacterium]